jgi:hypothetical protein
MRAALAELDEGEFTEGHELDRKWQVPKEMIGRLSQEEAKKLLARFIRFQSSFVRCKPKPEKSKATSNDQGNPTHPFRH